MPEPEISSELLELRDVVVRQAEVATPVLHGVDWCLKPGHLSIVVGLGWSGKSALLATAAGLIPSHSGCVDFFGHRLEGGGGRVPLEARLRLGLVFEQGGRLFPDLTVAENLALPVCYHRNCLPGEVKDWVGELVAWAGIEGQAELLPHRLARGLQQRAALARALALGPEVLLLDNPTGGLDLRERHWWRERLAGLIQGSPLLGGRPMALGLTTDAAHPWRGLGASFALIDGKHWHPLGPRETWSAREDLPVLQEILAHEEETR